MFLTIMCSLAAIGLNPQVPDHLVDLLSQHGWGQIESDIVLDRAAKDVTHLVASTHIQISPAELGEHLSFILAKHGISDVQVIPHMMRGEGPIYWSNQAPPLLKRFKRHLRPTHYGKALAQMGINGFTPICSCIGGSDYRRRCPMQPYGPLGSNPW